MFYDYDALERRITKTVGGSALGTGGLTTNFLPDGSDEIAELDGTTGAVQRRYIPGPSIDERIAVAEGSSTDTPTLTFFHVNHQGSVMAMTDVTGNTTCAPSINCQRLSYDEYGFAPDSATSGVPYRFAGRRFDGETGLYYDRARYYSPSLGRFMQLDSTGTADDLNQYAYTRNDPVNATDPNGTTTWCLQPVYYPSGMLAGPPHDCWDDTTVAGSIRTGWELLTRPRFQPGMHNNPYDPPADYERQHTSDVASTPPEGPDDEDGWDNKKGNKQALTPQERKYVADQIKSNPKSGIRIISHEKIGDPRFKAEGWAKYQGTVNVRGFTNTVHYMYNEVTGEVAQIKLMPSKGSLVIPR